MENTVQGGLIHKAECCISLKTPNPVLYFSSKGSALTLKPTAVYKLQALKMHNPENWIACKPFK